MATTDTICKVSSCAFHHPQDRCAAGEIKVIEASSDAICDTFVARDNNTQPVGQVKQAAIEPRAGVMADDNLNINLGNVGHLYEGDSTNLQPMVSCSAEDCTHNRHEVCFAPNITIDGETAGTSIDTRCRMYSK